VRKNILAGKQGHGVEVQMMDEQLYQHDVIGSIVAYKSNPTELEQAIRSFGNTKLRVKMLVVDNSPTEILGPICRRLGTDYLYTGRNHGFGAGHNIAIRQASTAKYHLVLNPDVQFEPNTLEELVAFLELNESVGLVMPRVFYPDGSPQKLCKRLPVPFDMLARRTFPYALKRLCHSRMGLFELSNLNTNLVLSVPYLSGCFMLLRKKSLLECGLFDERFFMYFEDVDLTRRIHERYETVYYPHAKITHRHDRGSYKSFRLLFYGVQSAIRYFNKWGWVWDERRDFANSVIGPAVNLSLPDRFRS
jgi:GT2 family glycosyltransferase